MGDEEKKAIKFLKKCIKIHDGIHDKTLLNLIEKQSKEIEELKEKAEKCEYYEMVADELYKNCISKDKIKAKIEDLEKEQEDNRKSLYDAVNNLCFKEIDKISDRISVNMTVREILQSLLEEE